MKHLALVISLLLFSTAAQAQKSVSQRRVVKEPAYAKYLAAITENELSAQLHFIASDFFEGRKAGTEKERAVAAYLASTYKAMGIAPLNGHAASPLEHYFQGFTFNSGSTRAASQNVLAFMEGSDPLIKDEVVVLVAHYDHLGIGGATAGDSVFNGAADDGSGTVALLEMAEALAEAKRDGVNPGRSILFLHTGAEEAGLHGSGFYVRNPLIPLDRVSAVVNLDGVGGTDKPGAANYVYLLYNDSTSLPLAEVARRANTQSGIGLDILKPENPQRFNSDSRSFEYELVPALYFSSGLTEHYHLVSDEPATIDYSHMARIVRLVLAAAWELADNTVKAPAVRRAQFTKTGTYFCVPCGCASDNRDFSQAGDCPDCRMTLQPSWRRR